MRGLMMDMPLVITSLIQFAAQYHGDTEIVSRSVEGPVHRYGYRRSYTRIQRLAGALARMGIGHGDRVATLAWNTYRHFELYYAVSGMGAICHTINPRLFPDQIAYIVNHAEDKIIFTDLTFVPLLEALADHLKGIEAIVVMTGEEHMPETKLANVQCYESLLAAEADTYDWPVLDENTASSLCYTSGTTGNPKGALYSHRSTLLHTYAIASSGFGASAQESMLPAVPMFHVNAWGFPYVAAMMGTKLVLPGMGYDGASMYQLLNDEKVTIAAGVPTLWWALLDHMRQTDVTLPHMKMTIIGGAAVPRSMIDEFEERHDVRVNHAWGMTEISPVGTTGAAKRRPEDATVEQRRARQIKQGRAIFGVDMKIVGDDGTELPHDGVAFGELMVRGPWVVSAYFKDEDASRAAFDGDGWFRTGDVSTIDEEGHMQIVDRAKDVIKSGGEWISSIDLENMAVGHPDVAEAAVIGIHHPKWDERPILVVVRAEGKEPSREDILRFLTGKVAKWWLPDDVIFVDDLPHTIFVDDLPHTATGKISKLRLRERFKDYRLPAE